MSRPRPATLQTRNEWWTAYLVLFAMAALWSLASPLFSVADEPAHVTRAAAVARGQFGGPESSAFPDNQVRTTVRVPLIYATATTLPACYIGRTDVAADCAPPFEGPEEEGPVLTQVGRYPPAYYLLTGWPSLFSSGGAGVRLMRLLTAAAAAALLASAFASARRAPRPAPFVLGLALAITPMAVFLAGSVNPSALEIAAAIGLWSSGAVLLLEGPGTTEEVGQLAARAGVAASVLVLSRQLGPLWAVLIVATLALVAGRERVLAAARQPAVRRWATVTAACAVVAVGWLVLRHTFSGVGGTSPGPLSLREVIQQSLGNTGRNILQMVGSFGWTDTPVPLLTRYAWFACLGFLAVAGACQLAGRRALAVAALATLVVLVPVGFESARARDIGFVWLGRYTLPLAAGLPILLALAAAEVIDLLGRRLTIVAVTLMVTGHTAAFVWAMRRFTGSVNPFGTARWSPPGSAGLLVVVFAGVCALYGWWLLRQAAPRPAGAILPAGD